MRIHSSDIPALKPLPGQLLVAFDEHTEMELSPGVKINFPTAFMRDTGQYVPRYGIIVAACEHPNPDAEKVDAYIPVRPGDIIFMDYRVALDAFMLSIRGEADSLVHVIDTEEVMLQVPYEMCFAYIREEDYKMQQIFSKRSSDYSILHPINGHFLVTTIPQYPNKLLKHIRRYNMDPYRFKVERVPKVPCKYNYRKEQPITDILEGDIITNTIDAGIALEHDMFKNKLGIPTCWAINSHRIYCVEK